MVLIDRVFAREIIDSRGLPTIEATVGLSNTLTVSYSVPSGESRGTHEALELRDKEYNRFFGHGVTHAIRNINDILGPRLKKFNPLEQGKVDQVLLELDNTPNKAHLGANALLAVSVAVAKAAAKLNDLPLYQHLNELFVKIESQNKYEEEILLTQERKKMSLPTPMFNLINGGLHAQNNLKFQEFMVVPAVEMKTFEKIRLACEMIYKLKEILKQKGLAAGVGDEGGFAPRMDSSHQALELLQEAAKESGYSLGKDVALALDVAANNVGSSVEELNNEYQSLLSDFPLIAIEDPFKEDDWKNWKDFAALVEGRVLVLGDDLTVTQRQRVLRVIEEECATGVIIKANQVGTLSETLNVAKLAKDAGLKLVVSHRSGETNDSFIADLAVGIGADFLKAGAPVRGERVAKYNRLIKIAEVLE